jgi:nitrite reductase (NADH) small subunit
MPEFVPVARVGDIPAGEGRTFQVGQKLVAVFYVDGKYSAIDDICPHMGASLSTGYVEDGGVTCPWHAWRFSISDGKWLDNPQSKLCQKTYAVQVIGEDVCVAVE